MRAASGAPAGSGGASEGSVNMSGWTPGGGVWLRPRELGEVGIRWRLYSPKSGRLGSSKSLEMGTVEEVVGRLGSIEWVRRGQQW